ncbi:DUF2007 domain-containing protein [Polaribacter sp. Asnod1-A03]|uniref:putative signal transducing protein n=1 Tax=Polaribacter sp. Asnod1-A03 TaxID=3160581 RepID=UPI00386AF62F
METKHIKIFSGSSILVKGLENLLEDNNIHYLIKDTVESARLAGFGTQINSVELYVLNTDVDKANIFVENYKTEINS